MSDKVFRYAGYYVRKNWIIIWILVLAAFFRFYNAFDRYSYGVESIRDAIVGVVGAHTLQAPIIGPFSSFGPFTFWPWYWYHLILGNIILPTWHASWIVLGITSLLNIFFLYKLGEILINKKFGYIVSFFGAISSFLIVNATLLTNPTMLHVYATASLYLFIRILKKEGTYWWGFVLGLTLGIGMNIHYQMVAYGFIPILLLILKWKKKLYALLSIVGIGITFIPLLIFDLNNNWYTLRNMTWAYATLSDRIYVPNSWTIYIRDLWPNIWSSTLGVQIEVGYILIVGVTTTMAALIMKKKLSKYMVIFSCLFILLFFHLRYHGGERSLGYVHYLMPFVFIYTSLIIYSLFNTQNGKVVSLGIMTALTLLIVPRSLEKLTDQSFVREINSAAEVLISKYPNEQFTVLHCKGDDRSRDVSLLYVLAKKGKLSGDGMPVSFESNCVYGEEREFFQRRVVAWNTSEKSDVLKKNFEELSLKAEFDDYTKWWVDENKKVYNW